MLLFFDTEFTGLHKNTTLISLGMVAENGKTFYAEFIDFDRSQVTPWIEQNVIDHLKFKNEIDSKTGRSYPLYSNDFKIVGDKPLVKEYLIKWIESLKTDNIQLVSDVCHYDMVLFIDIFGDAFSLPQNISPACHDINRDLANYYNISEKEAFDILREDFIDIDIDGDKHNALYDAKIIKACYDKTHKSIQQ